MKRKLTALLLAALMVCGSLAGCGSKITPEAEGSEGGDAPAAESTYPEHHRSGLLGGRRHHGYLRAQRHQCYSR